jgi:hypothetical protein
LGLLLSCNDNKTALQEKSTGTSLERIGLALHHEPEVGHDILTIDKNGVFHDSIAANALNNDLTIHPLYDPDNNYYSINNCTYQANNRISYEYLYIKNKDSLQLELLFDSITKKINNWRLVPQEAASSSTVSSLALSVIQGRKMFIQVDDDYNQTIVRCDYNSPEKEVLFTEYTGVIDNERNIWIHPPRAFLFKSLVISPWSFIKSPYRIGRAWSWDPKWPDRWSTKKWGVFNGNLENSCEYAISKVETINVELYAFECYVIESSCINSLGVFKSTFWFNPNIGFLKLHYENIDSYQIIFDAVEVEFSP